MIQSGIGEALFALSVEPDAVKLESVRGVSVASHIPNLLAIAPQDACDFKAMIGDLAHQRAVRVVQVDVAKTALLGDQQELLVAVEPGDVERVVDPSSGILF